MDSDQYVPINIIANFDQVKKLTSNKQLVVEVLKESSVVQVDESGEKVRPVSDKRSVLILREIADSTYTKVRNSPPDDFKWPTDVFNHSRFLFIL